MADKEIAQYSTSGSVFGTDRLLLQRGSSYENVSPDTISAGAVSLASEAFTLAVVGTSVGSNSYALASSAKSGADSAFSVAVAGTDSALFAQGFANNAYTLAATGTNVGSNAITSASTAQSTADSAFSGANTALTIAVAGTTLAGAAYSLAQGGTNISAASAYNLAAIGTNVGTNAINLANSAQFTANSAFSGANAAYAIAVAGTNSSGGSAASAVDLPGVELKGQDSGSSNISTSLLGGTNLDGIGALDFSFWVRCFPRGGVLDQASVLNFCGLSTNSSNNDSSTSFRAQIYIDGSLRVVSGGEIGVLSNRQKVIYGFHETYGGTVVDLVVSRSVADDEVYIYINGVLQTPVELTEGTPPAWSDPVADTYFNQATGWQGVIYQSALFLGTLTTGLVAQLPAVGIPTILQWGTNNDVPSGSLTPRRRYQVLNGTSITYDGTVVPSNSYFDTNSVTSYTETAATEVVYQVGAAVYQDMAIGRGTQFADRSPNQVHGAANSILRVTHVNSQFQTMAKANTQAIFLVNGTNSNVPTQNASQLIINGPTGDFMITGFALGSYISGVTNPVSSMLFVYNNTAQQLTISNENTDSDLRNRITTGTGGNVILSGRTAVFVYDDVLVDRWIMYSSS